MTIEPATHTPAPWSAVNTLVNDNEPVIRIWGGERNQGRMLAEVWIDTRPEHMPEDEANARVMAAAPELLASLETIVKLIRWGTWGEGSGEMEEGELQLAEDAISKALGTRVAYVKDF